MRSLLANYPWWQPISTRPTDPAAPAGPAEGHHVIRIGTRGSLLATTQAGVVRDALVANGHDAELVIVSTAAPWMNGTALSNANVMVVLIILLGNAARFPRPPSRFKHQSTQL